MKVDKEKFKKEMENLKVVGKKVLGDVSKVMKDTFKPLEDLEKGFNY